MSADARAAMALLGERDIRKCCVIDIFFADVLDLASDVATQRVANVNLFSMN